MTRTPSGGRRGARRAVLLASATGAPWLWFAVRDSLGVVGDVVAILLPLLVVAVTVLVATVGVRRRRPWLALPAASVLAAGVVAVAGPWSPVDVGAVAPPTATTVAAANVTSMSSTVPSLRDVDADVLVVSEEGAEVTAAMSGTYPHRELSTGTPGIGVYSRYPLRLLEPANPDLPGMRVAVDAPAPFEVIALHVPRPWITGRGGYQATVPEHHRLLEEVAARVARAERPVVVAGDLNATDRGRGYRLLDGELVDAARTGWTGPTSVTTWRALALRIDHLLLSPGWCGDEARRFGLPGSDHDGVVAVVGPCARVD